MLESGIDEHISGTRLLLTRYAKDAVFWYPF
jgi:hypothetical protein